LDSQPNTVIVPVADTSNPVVTLDASHSTDPSGLALTYQWSNPTHNGFLYNATSATATARLVGGKGKYTFAVIVTNSQGVSSSSTVSFNYTGN
jgi:hypothetical protein